MKEHYANDNRAIAIVNDELLDIDDVLKRYKEKLHQTSLVQSNTVSRISSLFVMYYELKRNEKKKKKKEKKKHFTFSTLSGLYILIHFFLFNTRINFFLFLC